MKIRNNKSRVLTMLRLIHKPKLAKIYRLHGRNKMFSGMLFFWSDYKLIKTKLLFIKHFNSHTLWNLGWSNGLSKKSKDTFKRYAVFRDNSILDTIHQDKFEPSDIFKLKNTYIKEV